MQNNLVAALVFSRVIVVIPFLFGCGTFAGNPGDKDENGGNKLVILPAVDGFDLSSQAAATEQDVCTDNTKMGYSGVFLNPVCASKQAVRQSVYEGYRDSDGDGLVTCDDFTGDDAKTDYFYKIFCNDKLLANNKVRSFRFTDDAYHAVSFTPFVADTAALGSWTAAGPESAQYPANFRSWLGDAADTVMPAMAMDLTSGDEGRTYMDLRPFGDDLRGETLYSFKETTSACETNPGKDTCHWEETLLKGEEAPTEFGVPPGLHIVMYGDAKKLPQFLAMEGKYRYTKEAIELLMRTAAMPLPPSFAEIRTLYFRYVLKGDEVWSSFDYQDESGKTIVATMPTPQGNIDMVKVLRDGFSGVPYSGVCQKVGTMELIPCDTIDYTDFASLWRGDANIKSVEADYVLPIDFGSPPTSDLETAP